MHEQLLIAMFQLVLIALSYITILWLTRLARWLADPEFPDLMIAGIPIVQDPVASAIGSDRYHMISTNVGKHRFTAMIAFIQITAKFFARQHAALPFKDIVVFITTLFQELGIDLVRVQGSRPIFTGFGKGVNGFMPAERAGSRDCADHAVAL